MARKPTLDQILTNLINSFTPEIAEAFKAAIQDIVDRTILKDVVAAIRLGDPERAFRVLGYSEAAMRPLSSAIENAFETGGVAVGSTFPKRLFTPNGPTIYRFDVRNVRAEKWLREKSGSLITKIGNDASVAVRNIMHDNMISGRNPRNTALDIVGRINPVTKRREGGVIGLNGPQERAVSAMRRDLLELNPRYFTRKRRDKRFDSIVRKKFKAGNVDGVSINKLTGRYKDNLLVLRGETIARDGALEALNRSEWEAMKQASDMGAISNRGVERIWDATDNVKGRRTRDDHVDMEGQSVGLDEAFVFPDGTRAMYPQDRSLNASAKEIIGCRCRVRTKINWLADLT